MIVFILFVHFLMRLRFFVTHAHNCCLRYVDLMTKAVIDRREELAASTEEAPPNDPLQKLLDARDEDGQPLNMDALTVGYIPCCV